MIGKEPITVDPSRRAALLAGFSLLGSGLARPAWASGNEQFANDFWQRPRRLVLQHARGERIETVYWSDGQVVVSEYERLSYFMRDRVAGTGVYVHPVLLDILYGIHGWLSFFQLRSPIIINSGYRDPARNAVIEGAARNSLHTRGEAVDISIPQVNTLQVAKFGMWLGGGGVGWYPEKQFTHLDRGRLRSWRG
jgi:uncharacterized protein YcbK (DUF882 family)